MVATNLKPKAACSHQFSQRLGLLGGTPLLAGFRPNLLFKNSVFQPFAPEDPIAFAKAVSGTFNGTPLW